jgi:hypothetical protein
MSGSVGRLDQRPLPVRSVRRAVIRPEATGQTGRWSTLPGPCPGYHLNSGHTVVTSPHYRYLICVPPTGVESCRDQDRSAAARCHGQPSATGGHALAVSCDERAAFGALFTAMLALLFTPAYVDLRELQRRIRDFISRIPGDGMPPESWYLERERLSSLLQLDSSALEAIRSATLLLGPFFTALVTLFVHDLKI